jgi:hypothetical protein
MRAPFPLALAALLLAAPHSADSAPELPGWLAGCWRLSRGATVVDEQWLPPLGGMMLGAGRTVRNGSVQEYEFLLIRLTPGGASYEAHPSGQEPATFTSTGSPDADEIVFENPAHDFPQRVGYRRVGGDSVVAWIEGKAGSAKRRIEFPYGRVSCTAP